MAELAPPLAMFLREYLPRDRGTSRLDLPRFGGHLTIWEGGIHHAENKTAVPAGLPASDG